MAFSIVRISNLTVSSMQVVFNDDIDTDVGISNVSIDSMIDTVESTEVISMSIEGNIIYLTYRPLFPGVQYKLSFLSTDQINFCTMSGEIISEDGNRNSKFITSPGDFVNEIRDNIIENLPPVYETDGDALIRKLINSTASELQDASDSIETVKSGNYLSVSISDEKYIRGDGPTDKLKNGGTFEIQRVGLTTSGVSKTFTINFNETRAQTFMRRSSIIVNPIIETLTSDPISLQAEDIINEKVTDDTDLNNNFSGLKIKVANSPVVQTISVSLLRGGIYTEYDIEEFGYTLKDNRYDTNLCGKNINLADNEIELSSNSITGLPGGFLMPQSGDKIYVSYIYKNLGKRIEQDTVSLTTIRNAVREIAPPIATKFSTKNAPIITQNDTVVSLDGVEFLSTQNTDELTAFESEHPAFRREIKYSLTRFPNRMGEYSINYETGEIYVFGEDALNYGTGDSPPAMNYLFRKTFTKDLDFTYNSDRSELAINSSRNISGIEVKISFQYENAFVEGVDFRSLSHVEVLNERIDNRLIGAFKIRPVNYPITNVFRLLNETTGELYSVERFDDFSISFSGTQAPEQKDIFRERANFYRISQESLLVSDEIRNEDDKRIFKINLQNNSIIDGQGRFIGANFDTSVLFSKEDIFLKEFFYEHELQNNSVSENINKITSNGDFLIDYINGIVYLAVSESQDKNLGDISYQYKDIVTKNKHVLSTYNIYRSYSSLSQNIKNYTIGNSTDTTTTMTNLESVGQRFVAGDYSKKLIVGSFQSGTDGLTTNGTNIFTSNSGIFSSDYIGRTLIVGSNNQLPIQELDVVGIIGTHQLILDSDFDFSMNGRIWSIIDRRPSAQKIITVDYDIISIKNIYSESQLNSVCSLELDGYFDSSRDFFEGNVITLGDTNPLQIGDSILVDYNYGNIFVDYRYLANEIIVSYEYGNNCIDWSISEAILPGKEYFVSYKYGALRDDLLANFGALTQIKQLTTFSPNLNREIYRSIVGGTLQSFINGPTIGSIEKLVESFTDVKPNIKESVFENWILGKDYLNLRPIDYSTTPSYDVGKFSNGIVINDTQNINVPAISHIRLNEGTIETWIRPQWNGIENDATLTFDLEMDGYSADLNAIFIGFSGEHPTSMPFSVSITDDLQLTNSPANIDDDPGYFIWYNDFDKLWEVRWRNLKNSNHSFSGTITTSGDFFNITIPTNEDGHYLNDDGDDDITSTNKTILFETIIKSSDEDDYSEDYGIDGISFASGDSHYVFDMANKPTSNRASLFKNGNGFLNFRVFDNREDYGLSAGFYNISTSVRDWVAGEIYHIAVSWKFNSPEEKDEMHLFIDGAEVTNIYKYGGNPDPIVGSNFSDLAEETIVENSLRPIIGGFDGISSSGSAVFTSEGLDFGDLGVEVGDPLYILESTQDGILGPNGGEYQISGVGSNTILIDSALTLSLSNIHFSINRIERLNIKTPINFQNFIVVTKNNDEEENELNGIKSEYPDYSVEYGYNGTHKISVYNGVNPGDSIIIKPRGLIFRQCKENIYVYGGGYDQLRVNSSAPINLDSVKITPIILEKKLISANDLFAYSYKLIGPDIILALEANLDDGYICQPSNDSDGRKLKVYISGNNINYDIIGGNTVLIDGTTYSGATYEELVIDAGGYVTTNEYWTSIDDIIVSIVPIDASSPAGIIEIKELKSITESENYGDRAEVAEVMEYSNGLIRVETYGAGGEPFVLNACLYEVSYPSFLKINIDKIPDTFSIGSDFEGNGSLDATIDEFRILDYMSYDTRIGETVEAGEQTVTTDYNASSEFETNDNTLLLLNYNNTEKNSEKFIDRFDAGFEIADSVNESFGTGAKFLNSKSIVINNAGVVFNNNEGTIEFWISPFDDSANDSEYHYYVDLSSVIEKIIESSTKTTVVLDQRAREIHGVYLASDTFNSGTNYFTNGTLSNVDNKTITLGIPLPGQNIDVKIIYSSVNDQGDRISIFKDPSGFVNFFVKASGIEHVISSHVDWKRHTWHRIMAMWKTNSLDNKDRLRLFVDGNERGVIKYGTDLLYGNGVIYGQEEVGSNRFIVDNIDLTDIFAKIHIGANIFDFYSARAIIDNVRFSNEQRLQSIRVIGGESIDSNYQENTSLVFPVVEDILTTAIYNFDKEINEIDNLATIINKERGIFRFEVEVIDSFDKIIGNTELENLLIELINTIKPSHTEAIITFSK